MKESNNHLYCTNFKIKAFSFRVFVTPAGILRLLINPDKNKSVYFDNAISLQPDDPYLFGVYDQLNEYFSQKRKAFSLPLDLYGTEFQLKVWNELKKIPYGITVSYKNIAEKIGNIKAVRAVGNANGANPVPIIIPCHRVINDNGKLGGYTGGINIKKKLLEIEGRLEDSFL